MQLFTCPFCGDRDEREFFFFGEMGKDRPDTAEEISAESWSYYLNAKKNEKGGVREVWLHLSCSEVFSLERDTATMKVTGVTAFRKGAS